MASGPPRLVSFFDGEANARQVQACDYLFPAAVVRWTEHGKPRATTARTARKIAYEMLRRSTRVLPCRIAAGSNMRRRRRPTSQSVVMLARSAPPMYPFPVLPLERHCSRNSPPARGDGCIEAGHVDGYVGVVLHVTEQLQSHFELAPVSARRDGRPEHTRAFCTARATSKRVDGRQGQPSPQTHALTTPTPAS